MDQPSLQLIVSADDVGLDPGITAAALRAAREGVVTSLSVMTVRPDWDWTAGELRSAPPLDLGVHLTLLEGRPVLPPEEVPSLVVGEGVFPDDLRVVLRRLATGRLRRDEVQREWVAQVRRAQEAGLSVTHVDGHQHIHLVPGLLGASMAARRACGVPGMRLVSEPGSGDRRLLRAALSAASQRARGLLRRTAVIHPARTIGVACSGRLTEERLLSMIDGLEPGVTELVTHPGGADTAARLQGLGMDWAGGYSFAGELAALCSPRVRARLDERGVQRIGYGELAAQGTRSGRKASPTRH